MSTAAATTRLRLSSWLDATQVFIKDKGWAYDDTAILSAKDALDDLSLLATVIHDATDVTKFRTEVFALSIASEWKKLVNTCHTMNVQLLVGYAVAQPTISTAGQALLNWLYSTKAPSPTISSFATKLKAFCDKNYPGMSGINFDIENITEIALPSDATQATAERKRRGQRWVDFYGAISDEFAKDKLIVAAALRPKAGDDDIQMFHNSGGTTTAVHDPDSLLHPYDDLAKGHSNFLLRPMCYDGSPVGWPDNMLAWHTQITEYAVGKGGTGGKCPAENFQLGVKISSSRGGKVVKVNGQVFPEIGIISTKPEVTDRCKSILRPNSAGLALFPLAGQAAWADIDKELNTKGGASQPGAKQGQPHQGPLGRAPKDEFKQVP